jgi:Ca2+-binding RTX toxin-like protein
MARRISGARTIAIFAALSVVLIVAAGPTLAKTITCVEDEDCNGTNKADKITGEGSNTIDGKRGDDKITFVQSVIYGSGGNDTLLSRGVSQVIGGGGNDTLEETEGLEDSGGALYGGNFFDGGSGDDKIVVRFGATVVTAGGGRDVIKAQNGRADSINCGGGKDTVIFDEGLDIVADTCEKQNP